MLKSILYFLGSLIVFLSGIVLYGIIINLREVTLSEAIEKKQLNYLSNIRVVADRKNYRLDLYSDTVLLKSYRVVFGRKSHPRKTFSEPYTTPAGRYFVCSIDTNSVYGIFLKISYPGPEDLLMAMKSGEITAGEFRQANADIQEGRCPRIERFRGKDFGIHGIGKLDFILSNLPFVYNWTNGSAAVSNRDIEELYQVIKIGTEVVIKN